MITQKANFIKDVRYVILKPSLIDTLDLNKKRGKQRVYLSTRNSIGYNTNKFFFQTKKGIIKFIGETPEEIKNKKQYTHKEILKKVNSSWGQWKLK